MRQILEGERVFVYWNLHQDTFSVRDVKGRVVAHMDKMTLRDATFVVQPAGRARVIKEGVKNVHAGVRGTYTSSEASVRGATGVTYNPFREGTFVKRSSREAVCEARVAILTTSTNPEGRTVPRVYARRIDPDSTPS